MPKRTFQPHVRAPSQETRVSLAHENSRWTESPCRTSKERPAQSHARLIRRDLTFPAPAVWCAAASTMRYIATGAGGRAANSPFFFARMAKTISRFGWSIKKALGTAVRRNRIRRRIREIVRLHRQEIAPGWDIVIHPRSSAATASFSASAADLLRLIPRAKSPGDPNGANSSTPIVPSLPLDLLVFLRSSTRFFSRHSLAGPASTTLPARIMRTKLSNATAPPGHGAGYKAPRCAAAHLCRADSILFPPWKSCSREQLRRTERGVASMKEMSDQVRGHYFCRSGHGSHFCLVSFLYSAPGSAPEIRLRHHRKNRLRLPLVSGEPICTLGQGAGIRCRRRCSHRRQGCRRSPDCCRKRAISRTKFPIVAAVVKSWKLKNYNDDQKPPQPLELVDSDGSAQLGWPLFAVAVRRSNWNLAPIPRFTKSRLPIGHVDALRCEITFHWSDGHLDVTKKLNFTQDYRDVSGRVRQLWTARPIACRAGLARWFWR